MDQPGKFIALEGLDGAGTTTQTRLLVQWLQQQGRRALATREPSDGPVGRLLRRVLSGAEPVRDPAAIALLFAADRLDHVHREIAPALARGAFVVSDRFVYSSLAYQGSELPLHWVETINGRAPRADLTLLLSVDPALAARRRQERGAPAELFETDQRQRRIARTYEELVARARAEGQPDGAPPPEEPRLVVVDGALPVDQVHQRLVTLVQRHCLANGPAVWEN